LNDLDGKEGLRKLDVPGRALEFAPLFKRKTTAMARNLQVDDDLSSDVQFVKDPSGGQSPLALSTNRVVVSNPGDGKVLLVLGSERSWVFKQRGSGAGTALELTAANPNNNRKFCHQH
jgi:hypothetical protein